MPDKIPASDGQVQAYKNPAQTVGNDSISNNTIVISAILCLGVLILVVGTTLVISAFFFESTDINSTEKPNQPTAKEAIPTDFNEGYSLIIPPDFGDKRRRETELGDVVYTYTGNDGCKLTFALINDDTLDRFSSPPTNYADALIQRIPELSTAIDGDVAPERVSVNGMPSVMFRFYEKETYRGVIFTYYMVSMDRGKKLALKIAGKHGKYSDGDANINMPNQWYDAMLTLKRTGPAR
ncbi:MAG: hypothetical protein CMM01_24710 [Rhodopirellula sp.]|nr:hypothetical protein [Rhodopirellula sp.]